MKLLFFVSVFLFAIIQIGHAECKHDKIFQFMVFDDPFVGTYTMVANGQNAGNITITHIGGNNYKVDTGNGYDMATRNGDVLQGTTEGYPFSISLAGTNLTMDLLGTKITLVRSSSSASNQTTPTGGAIDRRLLGVWRNGYTHNSGNAGSSSQTLIAFLEDGTFEYQESYTAGGSGWSGVSKNDPVQKGTYTILNMTPDGGTLSLNGQAMAYEIYVFQGEQKMSLGNYKTPWLKIR